MAVAINIASNTLATVSLPPAPSAGRCSGLHSCLSGLKSLLHVYIRYVCTSKSSLPGDLPGWRAQVCTYIQGIPPTHPPTLRCIYA